MPYTAGVALVGVGFTGLLAHASVIHPVGWAVWFAGAALAYDSNLIAITGLSS